MSYPKQLLENIAQAGVGAVNHYAVADSLLDWARKDVSRAAREGSNIITNTRAGNVEVHRQTARGYYRIVRFNAGPEYTPPLFEGTKAETIAHLATLYKIEVEA